MAAESEMRLATTDGVGRLADELVSTGTRAAKATLAPRQRGPSDQRSSGARVEAANEPDAAVPTQPRTRPARYRAAVQKRRRRVMWIDGRAGARVSAMIGRRMARGRRVAAMQVSRSEQGGDDRRRATGGPMRGRRLARTGRLGARGRRVGGEAGWSRRVGVEAHGDRRRRRATQTDQE